MTRREFQLVEGTAKKFWAIGVDGKRQTVQFGRIGTSGQTQTKDFATETEAQKGTDKLIAEKLKKGYAEVAAEADLLPPSPPALGGREDGGEGGEPAATQAPSPLAEPNPPHPHPLSPPKRAARGEIVASRLTVGRKCDLHPEDWRPAVWHLPNRTSRPPSGAPAPFDRATCLEQLARLPFEVRQGPHMGISPATWHWDRLVLPALLSPEEAHFWFTACAESLTPAYQSGKRKPRHLSESLRDRPFDGRVTLREAIESREAPPEHHYGTYPWFTLRLLPFLLEPLEVVEFLFERGTLNEVQWFADHLWSRLSDAEAESVRGMSRTRLAAPDLLNRPPKTVLFTTHLAALLGSRDELRAALAAWPDGLGTSASTDPKWTHLRWYGPPQRLVFALGDPDLIVAEMRRLKLSLHQPEQIAAWFALTGTRDLDYPREQIQAVANKTETERLVQAFGRANVPEAAPHVLELKLSSRAPQPARQWLEENVGTAIAGLIPTAAGRGKLAEAAVEYLRDAKRAGHADFIAEQLASAPPEITGKVRREVLDFAEKTYAPFDAGTTPDWLREALARSPRPTGSFPSWVAPGSLPPVAVGTSCLNPEQVAALLTALQKSRPGEPQPLVTALREYADPAALDAFAWRLFEQWLGEGSPAKEKWAMLAVGLLGGDASALKLTPLVRQWPGEGQHARAVTGLECLRAMGTDTALMQLNGIAQKVKFQGLKKKAEEFMEAIAADRGLSRSELEDFIVPDLGLDERGGRDFDFGPRRFRLVLGDDLKPMVRDEAGNLKGDLPKPGVKDDTEKATAAVADWKLLKKQLSEAAKVQATRLEQALVTQRRWPREGFEALLVNHPLMINLTRLLLWGGYDKAGQLVALFRVAEDRSYADDKDEPITLGERVVTVGLAHPIHLSEAQKNAWGQVFGDYELIPPFAQLGRPVSRLTPDEAEGILIAGFGKVKVHAGAFRGTLEKLGWTRGSPADHGIIGEFFRPFPTAQVTAVVECDPGIAMGMLDMLGDQTVKRAFFVPGVYKPFDYPHHKEKQMVPLERVDPLALSETLNDLTTLTAPRM